MASKLNRLFIFLLMFCCITALKAQQNSAQLPSLINNKTASEDDVEAALRKRLFVKVITSKNKIFVGEPLMVVYKFYRANNLNDKADVVKQPEFSGCSVKELNAGEGVDFETINNEPYAVFTIRKVQLTPLQPGSLSLGKALVSNDVEMFNPDDPYITKKYNIQVSNPDAAVDVIDLPKQNQPQNFTGITGLFDVKAAITKNTIPVGENDHLVITISGSGNFDAIIQPEIKWPANTDHFDGKDSQNVDENSFPITGSRVFDIPFIGKKKGMVVIPSVTFNFFNIVTKSYETVKTDSIAITFTKALARKDEFTNIVNYDISNRKYLWIVAAIALTVALFAFISYKKNKTKIKAALPFVSTTEPPVFTQSQTVYQTKYRIDFSRYLSELEVLKENKPFFAKAKDILTKAVAERVDSTQYSEKILVAELKQRTYNAPVCNKVAALYEAINLNLYAPYEIEADLDFYFNEVKNVVEELQKES